MRCNVDRNKKDRSFDQQYKSIEQLIREAYGLSPDQMEKRMEWAEAEAASDAPLGGRSIPNAPEHEFQTILSKMEARGITPRVMADFSRDQQRVLQSENGFLAAQRTWLSVKPDPVIKSKGLGPGRRESENAKKTFFSVPVRTAGAAAACVAAGIAIFTLRPGIDVMGKRNYTYVSEVRDGEKTDIVWNNQENYISDEGKLMEAYDEIKETVKYELGLTVSIGVSFNKIFAKLGSDMKKPDAITVIPKETFREQIWNLPASDMQGVGRATEKKLSSMGIQTIGEIARSPADFFRRMFGKCGVDLWRFANGLDASPVTVRDIEAPDKSVGHCSAV